MRFRQSQILFHVTCSKKFIKIFQCHNLILKSYQIKEEKQVTPQDLEVPNYAI